MRATVLVGLVTIAFAAPLCARADDSTVPDKFDKAAAIRETRTIQAVDTHMRRVTEAPRTTPPSTAAPEMSSGLAVTGLTLLLGGISVLRSRGNRSSA
jgi:hypothetical protein